MTDPDLQHGPHVPADVKLIVGYIPISEEALKMSETVRAAKESVISESDDDR